MMLASTAGELGQNVDFVHVTDFSRCAYNAKHPQKLQCTQMAFAGIPT